MIRLKRELVMVVEMPTDTQGTIVSYTTLMLRQRLTNPHHIHSHKMGLVMVNSCQSIFGGSLLTFAKISKT